MVASATAIYSVTMVFWKETAFPLQSHGKALEKECCLPGVFCDSGDTPANLLLLLLLFLTPVLNSRGMKKIRYAIQKVQKSSWNEPYSSSSFTIQSCSKMALYRWIRTKSRWNKKLISLPSPDWSANLQPSIERKTRPDALIGPNDSTATGWKKCDEPGCLNISPFYEWLPLLQLTQLHGQLLQRMSRPTDRWLLRPKSVAFQPPGDLRMTIRPFPVVPDTGPLDVCVLLSVVASVSFAVIGYATDYCALTLLVGRQEGHLACKKLEWWGAAMVIYLERGADLHLTQLMSLPLTVSCFSKFQIGCCFTFLVPAHPGKSRIKGR